MLKYKDFLLEWRGEYTPNWETNYHYMNILDKIFTESKNSKNFIKVKIISDKDFYKKHAIKVESILKDSQHPQFFIIGYDDYEQKILMKTNTGNKIEISSLDNFINISGSRFKN